MEIKVNNIEVISKPKTLEEFIEIGSRYLPFTPFEEKVFEIENVSKELNKELQNYVQKEVLPIMINNPMFDRRTRRKMERNMSKVKLDSFFVDNLGQIELK